MSLLNGKRRTLPEGWSVVQMDQLKAGNRYSFVGGPFGSNLTRRDYTDNQGVPVIRGSNLGGETGRFVEDGFVYVSEDKADSLLQNLAYPGDLIFTQRGTLGQVVEIPKTSAHKRYVVSQSQMKLTVNSEKACPRFIFHFFRSPWAVNTLSQRIQATGVPHINLEILKSFPVILPPLPEQRRIAAILDKADAIRRKREEAIRLTEELLRSTFLKMFGDPATAPAKPLAGLAEVVSGVTKGRKLNGQAVTVPYLRVANVQDGFLNLDEIKMIEALPDEVEALALKPGDIVMTEGGDHDKLGRGAIWTGLVLNCIHQNHVFRVRVNRQHILPDYFAAYLRTNQAKRYFLRCAKKTTNLASINMTQLRGLPVPVPSVRLQQKFQDAAKAINGISAARKQAVADAQSLFGSLVQRAFLGELTSGEEKKHG